MRIAILALEGTVFSAVAGLADLFWIANKAIGTSPGDALKRPEKKFETLIVSHDGAPVWDTEGRLIHIDCSFQAADAVDAVIAPGMLLSPDLQPINLPAIRHAADWFRTLYEKGTLIAAAGTGIIVLGEAGLLSGRSYTTTWWVRHMVQERYPDAICAGNKSLQEDRGVITSGGCFSWVSLALLLIEKQTGPEGVALTSEMSLNDNHLLHGFLNDASGGAISGTPFMIRAQQIVRLQNPAISAAQLAAEMNMTERTLQRRMKALSQETPKEFITRNRIELACNLLASTGASIQQVATECGYSEDSAFRKAFNLTMEMSPAQYRQWIQNRSLSETSKKKRN